MSNQLFQILGIASFDFQLVPNTDDADKDSKIPRFTCQSYGSIAYRVSQYNQRDRSSLKEVIFLKVSSDYGLIPAFPKNGKAYNHKEILDAIELQLETKITTKNWTENDPILLLVATYLWQSLPIAKDARNLNALSDRVAATAKQWIDAYTKAETALSLPQSLRDKFIALMLENFDLVLTFAPKAPKAPKAVEAPKTEVPASSNGFNKAVALVTV